MKLAPTSRLSSALSPRRLGIPLVVLSFTALFAILIHSSLRGNALGADFYTFWLAGKAMVLERQSPYSPEVTLQSQMGIYGRSALPEEDQVAFAYPPYSVVMLLPLLPLPFSWAYAIWLSANITGLLTLLFTLVKPAARPLSITALLFFPVFICLATGNFSVLIGGIVLLFFGLTQGREKVPAVTQVVTAALLAWSTTKPQFMWLFIIFIVLVALRQRLLIFLGAFFSMLLALLVFSFAFVPGWITEWTQRVQQYAGYVSSRPTITDLLMAFLPENIALIMSLTAVAVGLAFTTRLFIKWWRGQIGWLATLAWVGLFTYLVHLHGISYEQMTFLVPLFLWTGQQKSWKSPAVLFFWFGSIAVSWLAFLVGSGSIAVDRLPVVFNAAWVAWLFLSKSRRLQV